MNVIFVDSVIVLPLEMKQARISQYTPFKADNSDSSPKNASSLASL